MPRDAKWPDQLRRRLQLPINAHQHAWFIAPEDLILKKMDAYREGGSEKHLRDITGILKTSDLPIDRSYINSWACELELNEIWDAILRAMGEHK